MSNKTLFEPLKFHSLAHQSVPCFMSALSPKAAATAADHEAAKGHKPTPFTISMAR